MPSRCHASWLLPPPVSGLNGDKLFRISLHFSVTGYGAIARYFTPNPYTLTSVKWARGMLSTSMMTNIVVTLLTAGKIWSVIWFWPNNFRLAYSWLSDFRKIAHDLDGLTFGPSQHKYDYVILLIVESGVVMAASKAIEFTLFLLAPPDGLNGLNALYIIMDCMPQIMVSFSFVKLTEKCWRRSL